MTVGTMVTGPWRAIIMVIGAMALATLANALIFYFEINAPRPGKLITPAGWEWVDRVVGFMWVILFALMALGAWFALNSGRPTGKVDASLIFTLLVICLLYPVYTLGFQPIPGLVSNVVVLLISVAIAIGVWRSSPAASVLLMPVILWIAIATVYVWKLITANRIIT